MRQMEMLKQCGQRRTEESEIREAVEGQITMDLVATERALSYTPNEMDTIDSKIMTHFS